MITEYLERLLVMYREHAERDHPSELDCIEYWSDLPPEVGEALCRALLEIAERHAALYADQCNECATMQNLEAALGRAMEE